MPNAGQLADLRVIELAHGVAGPFCGKVLADDGADVVKVERRTGDPDRVPDAEARFLSLNAGKRSIALELDNDEAWRVVAELVRDADVVIEDLPPGEFATRIGDTPPSLVVCSITPFGQSGPKSHWRGGDLIGYAAGGLAFITGDEGREPLQAGCEQALHLAGLQALAGVLLAVFHARRTGQGQRVDVSVQEAVASVLESTLSEYQYHGVVRCRMGTHHPAVHGVGMQRLADGRWLFVGTCPRQSMWDGVKEVMGHPAWAEDPRWDDPRLRRRHAEEIDRLAAETFSTKTLDEVYRPLQDRGVPVSVVNSLEDVTRSPQLLDRGFFERVDQPGRGPTLMPGPLWRTTAPRAPQHPAPSLGQHSGDIHSELGQKTVPPRPRVPTRRAENVYRERDDSE